MKGAAPALLLMSAALGLAADWSPQLAAQYLDARQKLWFAWPRAASADGPCVSCHTGLGYLLARPALRQRLGESQPTVYEKGLLDRLRTKAGAKPPGGLQAVEVIFTALFLAQEETHQAALSQTAVEAFDQLWSMQAQEGTARGSWRWFEAGLDPWETPVSNFYGTALAALAVGATPAAYRNQPKVQEHVAALAEYLRNEQPKQPLHNRLALLWAASRLSGILSAAERQSLIDEILKRQQPDGGWTAASLGPWMVHPGAPPSEGSSTYASGYVAYVLEQAGMAPANPALARVLTWLRAHQDRGSGAWPATSLNKVYAPDSMESQFMQDAATSFASMALLAGGGQTQ
jgi:squalene-hopene/tetraprenyl-beta-curcumene cyclase